MATIRTTYEVRKPSEQFYSVSRNGFTDVITTIKYAVDDILSQGAMNRINTVFFDSTVTPSGVPNPQLRSTTWPPQEILYTLVNPGIGYKVGDQIGNVFTVQITGVTSTGAISTYALINNQPMANTASIVTTHVSGTATHEAQTRANLVSSTGNVGLVPPAAGEGASNWTTLYGANGGGGSAGSRWPQTAFLVPFNANIKVGQLIELDSTATNDANSAILANTRIVSLETVQVVTGQTPSGVSSYTETTTPHYNIIVNNPITIKKNDTLLFKGVDATFENFSNIRTPNNLRVTLESTGAIDPLSDQIGVFGNVLATTTNSNLVQITNLTITGNTWTPVIYAGQTVTSTNSNTGTITSAMSVTSVSPAIITAGSFVTGREYIIKTSGNTNFTAVGASANVAGTTFIATGAGSGTGTATDYTISNVALSRTHSFTQANERLQFVFSEIQPWRIMFEAPINTLNPSAGAQAVNVYAATELQLPNDCTFSNIYNVTGTTIVDRAGIMGNVPTGTGGSVSASNPEQGFLNRTQRVALSPGTYPLNYMLTLTNRGVFFGMWEGNWSTLQKTQAQIVADKDNYFNWFLIQRPVNRVTGQVLTTGNAPVFCVNSVGYKYWRFIVREADAPHPTQGNPQCESYVIDAATGNAVKKVTPYRVPADSHSVDSFAVINSSNQIALTEDSKYLVSFLTNLSTPRFRYSEELDMIGQTSADVCGAGLDISITAYQESGPRKYRALPANGQFNSGLRICVLKDIA